MEFVRGVYQEIKKSIPKNAHATTAVFTEYGVEDDNPIIVDIQNDGGVVAVEIPFDILYKEGKYQADINFSVNDKTYSAHTVFDVRIPYLELWEVKDILSSGMELVGGEISDDECLAVERSARKIIDVYCGQSFGGYRDKKTIYGTSSDVLEMPLHLEKIYSMTENGVAVYNVDLNENSQPIGSGNPDEFLGHSRYMISGSGWFIKQPRYTPNFVGTISTTNPITTPAVWRPGRFKGDVAYVVDGFWGYTRVPEDIREAMRLLVNDYACGEQSYRDRFIESMRTSEWNFSFNSGAFEDTGNARVNTLLSPYVVNRMMIF